MNPVTTIIVKGVIETCSGMVITRALKPIIQSASGLTKVALWVGVFGLSSAGGALASKVVVDSINNGLELSDEVVENSDD